MTIRERQEVLEEKFLSKFAALSKNGDIRERYEEKCPVRMAFRRDTDRIVHSKAFRRLKHKTQVFISPDGDHFRTRLTHTLEVTMIARTIARGLSLSEDLTEAISLGHDLGHTPFGHAGERTIDKLFSFGFSHYEQSLRVVERIENNGAGLNLTVAVRDGILNHTSSGNPSTLEGQIVQFADRIAYINHDIDDAIRAGVLVWSDVPDELGKNKRDRINTLVMDVILNSLDQNQVTMSPSVYEKMLSLRTFMFDKVYRIKSAIEEEEKVAALLTRLAEHYFKHTEELPKEYQNILEGEGTERAICDYISGMTDRFAEDMYKRLTIPKGLR